MLSTRSRTQPPIPGSEEAKRPVRTEEQERQFLAVMGYLGSGNNLYDLLDELLTDERLTELHKEVSDYCKEQADENDSATPESFYQNYVEVADETSGPLL